MTINKKSTIIIKSIPIRFFSYFQWLILGLYEMEKEDLITLKFKLPLYQQFYYNILNNKLRRFFFRVISKFNLFKDETYLFEGKLKTAESSFLDFCFDIADSPFLFDEKKLALNFVYFKAQCPAFISSEGFKIADGAVIPFTTKVLEYKHQILPAMLGPRRLAWSINYTDLKNNYENYTSHKNLVKPKKLMCYFGDAKGPRPVNVNEQSVDFNNESHILGHFGSKVSHPNEKRYQLYKILKGMGDSVDAKLINKGGIEGEKNDLPVPLVDFTSHVSNFEYNLNVSGFRLSIPNRFIESFMVGTAIVTDKLSVKWYREFEEEVIELSEMGYHPMENINMLEVKSTLNNLPPISGDKILALFEKKWSPSSFGRYIIEALNSYQKNA